MRNFEERMAEIKKRSHARILRRRHQITALCVPLIGVLCVSSVLLIPQKTAYYSDDTVPTETALQLFCGSVTVVNGDETVTYSSRETVDAVRHLLSSLPPMEDTVMDATQKNIHDFTGQATALITNYTIILQTEEGTMEYKLLGNFLINRDTKDQYEMTDMQRTALLKLLELL